MKSIRIKLVLLLALSAAIALSLSSVALFVYTFYEKKRENLQTLGELTVIIAENLLAPVEFGDNETSRLILKTLETNADIESASVFTEQNTLFASYVKDRINTIPLKKTTSKMYENNDIKKEFMHIGENYITINYPILSDGEYIGSLSIISNTNSLYKAIKERLILQFLVSIISLIIIVILAFKLQKLFTIPILNLKKAMEQVTVHSNYEVRVQNSSKDEFKSLNDGFNSMIETIATRTNEIQELLDHADQGFLSFSKDLIIHKQYSKECIDIFSKKIGGLKISDLLFKDNNEKKAFFEETLISLFDEEDDHVVQEIISLLKSEFLLDNKRINVQYTLYNNHFMLILTDITEKIKLEQELDFEKNILNMVVSSVSSGSELFELLYGYENFIKNIQTNVSAALLAKDNLAKLYRDVHTYKGLFLQKDFINTPKGLHVLETKLSELQDEPSIDNNRLLSLLGRVKFEKWLENDKNILKSALGKDFFAQEAKIKVDKNSFARLERDIKKLLQISENSTICEDVIMSLKKCKYKSLKQLIEPYSKIVQRVSETLDKKVHPLIVDIDENISVSNEIKSFIDTLIHIFRNSVDHGIESVEERFALKKIEFATISVVAIKTDDDIIIKISDDGKGIDLEKIKSISLKKKIFTQADLDKMSEDEILNIIFSNYFSTSESVTDISGRGVGLSAVKYELSLLGGDIAVETKIGVGTTFIITLPKGEYVI